MECLFLTRLLSLGWEDSLEKGTATDSTILVWRIPWTVQSLDSQRVGHNWVTFTISLDWVCWWLVEDFYISEIYWCVIVLFRKIFMWFLLKDCHIWLGLLSMPLLENCSQEEYWGISGILPSSRDCGMSLFFVQCLNTYFSAFVLVHGGHTSLEYAALS